MVQKISYPALVLVVATVYAVLVFIFVTLILDPARAAEPDTSRWPAWSEAAPEIMAANNFITYRDTKEGAQYFVERVGFEGAVPDLVALFYAPNLDNTILVAYVYRDTVEWQTHITASQAWDAWSFAENRAKDEGLTGMDHSQHGTGGHDHEMEGMK